MINIMNKLRELWETEWVIMSESYFFLQKLVLRIWIRIVEYAFLGL